MLGYNANIDNSSDNLDNDRNNSPNKWKLTYQNDESNNPVMNHESEHDQPVKNQDNVDESNKFN